MSLNHVDNLCDHQAAFLADSLDRAGRLGCDQFADRRAAFLAFHAVDSNNLRDNNAGEIRAYVADGTWLEWDWAGL